MTLNELCTRLDTSIDGISRYRRKLLRDKIGLNIIPTPNYCPPILCCLLPCLRNTKKMQCYKQSIPDFAEVKIDGKWTKIDPAGLVTGDIIKIVPGLVVPADMRIYDVWTFRDFLL